jgi:hypothetical protein
MKINKLRSKPAFIAKTRWASYAAAGAATALAGSQSAEAAIHYSGRVAERFLVGDADSFNLDQPGDFFRLFHRYVGEDDFSIFGIASAAFRGFRGGYFRYVSKLSFGQPIAMGNFTQHFSGYWSVASPGSGGTPASASSVSDLITARGFNMDGHGLGHRVVRIIILFCLTTHMPTLVSR